MCNKVNVLNKYIKIYNFYIFKCQLNLLNTFNKNTGLAMYSKTTRNIHVTVISVYLDGYSSPSNNHYVWAYRVKIKNSSKEIVRITKRHWQIIDSTGIIREISGIGVVGNQPILKPEEHFEYTSACPLTTPSGIMVGSYTMETNEGIIFKVSIPAFSLDSPHDTIQIN
ncbi:hypothetical protein A1OE_793 [Candidatus Endolissoclinum faulkneri L2]|uniref:Protein ApaG n=2 Tax=Candidatus Endolissoclinum faulkneri TaxID=1263979 RepID=K7Z4Q1_9PROT|nr:hypothetical protein A1OE_793 [Candidatus Endolissoclinum faulkneri L2]